MNEKNMKESVLWVSLGENCLPDDILKRHGLKSFSTPYSSGRSNIDYAISLELNNYESLLDKSDLHYCDYWGKSVVRSKKINLAEDIFDVEFSKGFEFTHHDPLQSNEDKLSYERKIARLKDAKKQNDIVFLYHHRTNPKSDLDKVKAKLSRFASFYTSESARCCIALFHQNLVLDKRERSLAIGKVDGNVIDFQFNTEFLWGGADASIFWAKNDDDLIVEMLNAIDIQFIQSRQ